MAGSGNLSMADGLGLFRFADARDEEDLTETTDSDTAMDLRFLATKLHKKMAQKACKDSQKQP